LCESIPTPSNHDIGLRLPLSDQIVVPPELPPILKAFTKEVIRYNPADLVAFSRDYFTHLAEGPESLREFLDVYESRQRPSPDSQDG